MPTEKINPIALVQREMKSANISFKIMAERLDRDPATVQVMLTKDTMSFERLLTCSKALNYNFFLEIGYKIPYPGPADPKGNPLTAIVRNLENELKVKELKIAELQTELQKVISEADIQKRLLETELNTIKQLMKDIFAARQM